MHPPSELPPHKAPHCPCPQCITNPSASHRCHPWVPTPNGDAGDVVRAYLPGLDACDPVESTSELGTPVYIDPRDVSRGFGFATIAPEVYNNLFTTSPKRVYTFPSGTNCTLVAHGPNEEPFVTAEDNHLNLPPAPRLPVTRPKKRQLTTTPKLSKAQCRAKNKG